jgi:hypothetical protein
MKKLTVFLIPLFLWSCSSDELEPFTSDGCSSFPDGTLQQQTLWLNCCIKHDLAYWKGGTYDERLTADLSLEQCVADIGEPNVGRLMLAGVRVGGSPYWPTTYRWGYGWGYPRGYKALTHADKQQVKQRLSDLELMLQTLQREVSLSEDHTQKQND